jgi:hypothetical protein
MRCRRAASARLLPLHPSLMPHVHMVHMQSEYVGVRCVKWDSRSVSRAGGIERECRERNRMGRRSDPLNALRRGRLREIRCRRDIFLQNGSGTLGLPQILAVNQNHQNVRLQKPWSSGQIRPQRRGRMQTSGAQRKHAVRRKCLGTAPMANPPSTSRVL